MQSIPVIYENDDILIINKQSGLAVQGGEGISHSVDDLLSAQMNQKVYLVHRLDKDTAGILVVAKNPKAAAKYTEIFAGKKAKKEYVSFCCGLPAKESGTVNAAVEQKGAEKNALTRYQLESKAVLETEETTVNLCSIKWCIETGRMHQIRIHAAKIGAPIVADDKHGNFKVNKLLKKALGAKKLMLAAVKLTIPVKTDNGKEMLKTFEIPLPEHMQQFAEKAGLL